MKNYYLQMLLTIFLSMIGVNALAHDIELYNADGKLIYYNYINNRTELEVTYKANPYSYGYGCYSGDIIIPESVNYEGKTYAVTSIGYMSFFKSTELTSVILPNSIITIQDGAFNQCSNLCSIVMSNNLTSIGENGFYDCLSLTNIDIPSSVKQIGQDAFLCCGALISVNITNLSKWCDISFASEKSNPLFHAKHLVINGEEAHNLVIPEDVLCIGNYAFYNFKELKSITIPNNVKSIGSYAFYGCSELSSITISQSVGSIGSYAFAECSELSSITIPQSVSIIGEYAFYGCKNLYEINFQCDDTDIGTGAFSTTAWYKNLPDGVVYMGNIAYEYKGILNEDTSIYIKEGTTKIAQKAFRGKSRLTNIYLPNSLKKIGENAFEQCNDLTSIVIPENVSYVGAHAFEYCTNLFSVDLPDKITAIENSTFYSCINLFSISIPQNVTSIGSRAFSGCWNLSTVNILGRITKIEDESFDYCKSLTSIYIPNSVKSIGNSAFSDCQSLLSIEIPDSVSTIGKKCFKGCVNLSSITLGKKFSITYDNNNCFEGCDNITSILFRCTYVSDWFKGFTSLKSVSFEESVLSIKNSAFEDCTGIESVTFKEGLENILSSAFRNCENITSITIPNSLKSIGSVAFAGCKKISSTTIPQNVSSIGDGAFSGCSGLTSIQVDQGNAVYDSREDCNAIIETQSNKLITGCANTSIPESVTQIGTNAFYGMSDLQSIFIHKSITKIGSGAFLNCSGIASIKVDEENGLYDSREDCNAIIETQSNKLILGCMNSTIPESVAAVASYAFTDCFAMSSLTIPKSVVKIEDQAFLNCTGITTIIVDSDNPKYDSRNNCNAIIETASNRIILACNSTKIPSDISDFGSYAFSNCTTFRLPNNLETIPINMFYNSNNLETIIIPNNIKRIPESSFSTCSKLRTVIIEDGYDVLKFEVNSPTKYTTNPHWFSNSIDSLYIGRNVNYTFTTTDNHQTHSYSPFRNHASLRTILFGDSVTVIPNGYFSNCSDLTTVKLSNNTDTIGYSAFYNCNKLESISFGPQLEYIGPSAFQNCASINPLVIPNNIKTIGYDAFRGLNLSTLIIEDGEESIITEGGGTQNYIISGTTIDSIYWGRNGVLINYSRIKHLTLGGIKYWGGNNCDTINVLTIRQAPDTLHFYLSKEFDYFYYTYNYHMPFNNKVIDSVYCNRIIDMRDNHNTGRIFYPFEGVKSSFKLEIGKDITSIGEYMFASCKIPSIFIPKNISRIASTAFNSCSTLSSVIIEDGEEPLDFCEGGNFKNCPLDSVYLGRNMNYTTLSPFRYNREGIKHLTLGDDVTELGEVDFLGHVGLSNLTLPQNLKKIGTQAFYGCNGLKEITIPQSVTEIGDQAFDLCRNLTTINIEDGTETLNFIARQGYTINTFSNSPLENLYLGRNLNFTNLSPFSLFDSLKALTIGGEVTHLADRTFVGCPNLNNVTSYANAVPTTGENVFTPSYLPNDTLHVPYELYNQYKVAPTWKDFGNIVNFEGLYNLTYIVDGEVYKESVIEQHSPITPEAEPTKEGYSFSGWSEIPETMPAHDVTITGYFTANKYNLIYQVDGVEYKTYEVEYGATITPEEEPTKEGYTFSGWSEIPETMPAQDVTITGTFSINSYKLVYMVDGAEYRSYEVEYGTTITPEAAPTDREGYSFSGWSEIPETMPAHDVTITGTFSINKYKLIYMVDGAEYRSYEVEYSATITAEAEPTKEGYTFSGWSEIPEIMPAHDVTITGTFSINSYKLVYMVDGAEHKTYEVEYGTTITPEAEPKKEGYTFSGWSEIPATMPAHDVTITGSFNVNKYKLIYMVDGVEYKSYEIEYGASITPEAEPTKEGYTFSGWSEIPATMPAHDVTVTGTFTFDTGLNQIMSDENGDAMIFTIDGKRVNKLQKNLNIIRMKDGTTRKVVKK